MNLRFHHLVLVAAAFISAMAVAECPISKNIPHLGVYYLCGNWYWNTDCGSADHYFLTFGLLWSKKQCNLINALSTSESSLGHCHVYKDPEVHRECIYGWHEVVKDRLFN